MLVALGFGMIAVFMYLIRSKRLTPIAALIIETIIFGVNEDSYDARRHHVVSSSICDANAAAPVLRVLDDAFGIDHGYITTLHPWLGYQNLSDGSVRSISSPGHYWQDFSLGRATTSFGDAPFSRGSRTDDDGTSLERACLLLDSSGVAKRRVP